MTIAAAPDFTESLWAGDDGGGAWRPDREGRVERPSDYAPEPYVFTRRLIEEARGELVFDRPSGAYVPCASCRKYRCRCAASRRAAAFRNIFAAPDVRLTLVKAQITAFPRPIAFG